MINELLQWVAIGAGLLGGLPSLYYAWRRRG